MTTAQRARLVLSLGVLNLVLATIAIGIGGVGLQQRAEGSGQPLVAVVTTPTPGSTSVATPSQGPGSTGQPGSGQPGTGQPIPSPAGAVSPSPNVVPAASQGPTVGQGPAAPPTDAPTGPTAAPTADPTPAPIPARTPTPTARPTPRPTPKATPKPTPKPIVSTPNPPAVAKVRPPCPTEGGPPPGHSKTADPHKPCKDKSNGNGSNSAFFLVLPLLATGTAYVVRPERLRPRRRAR